MTSLLCVTILNTTDLNLTRFVPCGASLEQQRSGPHRVGVVRAILSFAVCPGHRLRGLGQVGQGLGLVQLQTSHQPDRPHRILEHGDRVA